MQSQIFGDSGPEIFGNGIVVGKSDPLGDVEFKSVAEFMEELVRR